MFNNEFKETWCKHLASWKRNHSTESNYSSPSSDVYSNIPLWSLGFTLCVSSFLSANPLSLFLSPLVSQDQCVFGRTVSALHPTTPVPGLSGVGVSQTKRGGEVPGTVVSSTVNISQCLFCGLELVDKGHAIKNLLFIWGCNKLI